MNLLLGNSTVTLNQTGVQYYNQTDGATDYDMNGYCMGAYYFQLSIEMLSTVIGFPSNTYMLYLMMCGGVERSTSEIFKLSLVVLDIVYCLSLPLDLSGYILFNSDVYMYVIFIFGLNEIGAPLLLTCVCLEHYVAVMHPIIFMKFRNGHHRLAVAALMWVATLTYSSLMVMSTIQQKDYIFIVPFVAAFLVILFCNVTVLWALRQSGPVSNELHPAKKQAFRTVLGIFIIITVSFLPTAATYPFDSMLSREASVCFVFPITYSFIILRAPLHGLFILAHARKLPCMTPGDLSDPDDSCLCC